MSQPIIKSDCPSCSDPFPLENIFNSCKEMSDCSFIFTQNGKPEAEIVTRIHAHKLVLATRSPVFKAMFYGPLAEKDETIIPDISPEVFYSMLKYVYTGKAIADNEDLFALFKAVDKYDFSPLLKKLEIKLVEKLSIDNALETYEFMDQFQKVEITAKISSFICENTMLILKHSSFIQIQRSTLKFVLSQKELNAAEIQLFDACLRWAKAECAQNGIENPTPAELRNVLGEELFLIRFPTMNIKNFIQGPAASGLFEIKEQNELVNYILASIKPSVKSEFVSHFTLGERNFRSLHPLVFNNDFKAIPTNYSTNELTINLQIKTSSDVLLLGFSFGPVRGSFTIANVCLFEDLTSIFVKEKLVCTNIKEQDGKDSESYSIKFSSPLLISAGFAYKLTICLNLNQVQTFTSKFDSEMFMDVKYNRKNSDEVPILFGLLNTSHHVARIYSLSIH